MTNLPLSAYAFFPSPVPSETLATQARDHVSYGAGNVTLIAEEAGRTVATVTAIPMRQNVRGRVYPMAGIASVSTHPLARRQGHIRALLPRLLGELRDDGHPISALYPFRSSFYQRFGYIGLPKPPTVSFSPADLAPLLRADLPGEIGWEHIRDGFDGYRGFVDHLLSRRHGFGRLPDHHAARLRDKVDRWLVTARVDGELVGALTYRISDHGADLIGDDLLTTGPLGRALLLQFFARHVDQVARVSVTVDPDEAPEQWLTDLTFVSESRVAFPMSAAPMARVLSIEALAGMPVGPGRVTVTVVDDPLIAGEYLLDGASGELGVSRVGATVPGARVPAATLTVPGLSGLVYGVLDPAELALRGLGTVPDDAAGELRGIFPHRRPYLMAQF
ncbi:GNAT family N-acetyltransferase [Rugosimonospora acidiphila]|uniref:GNAT family N-acetyltransferase n=1 Tax=Rugosimonospora acidiphila TaxID=556531 RepID=UPI0031EE8877